MEMNVLWRIAFCLGFLIAAFAALVIGLLIAWASRTLRETSRELENLTREMGQSLEASLEEAGNG